LAILGVLGFLGRDSITPKIFDKIFGISDYVLSEITKRIDSGYSGTFVFRPDSKEKRGQLYFYAEAGQPVKVTLNASLIGNGKFNILVDGEPWEREIPHDQPFYRSVHADITKRLKFDIEPGGNVHTLQFQVLSLGSDAVIVVDSLVLVYNK
jgi:hypothetical protein